MWFSLLLLPSLVTAFVVPKHYDIVSSLAMRNRAPPKDVRSWITRQQQHMEDDVFVRYVDSRGYGRDFGGPPPPPPYGPPITDGRPNAYRAPRFDGSGNPIFDGRDQFGRPIEGDRELYRQERGRGGKDEFGRPFSTIRGNEGPPRDRLGRPIFAPGSREAFGREYGGDYRRDGGPRDQWGRPLYNDEDRRRVGREDVRREQQPYGGGYGGGREPGRDQYGRPGFGGVGDRRGPQDTGRRDERVMNRVQEPRRDNRSQMVPRDDRSRQRDQQYGARGGRDGGTYTDKNISVRDMRLHFMVPSTIPGQVFHQMSPRERFDHDEVLVVDGNVLKNKLPKFAYFAELTNEDIVEYLNRFYRY